MHATSEVRPPADVAPGGVRRLAPPSRSLPVAIAAVVAVVVVSAAFSVAMADLFARLMTDVLGYDRRRSFWQAEETGYHAIQGTKPQTAAYALTDSPAGLAAWIVEKFQTWSDHRGDFEGWLDRDSLLTNITLYWVTGAINSSFWPYYAIRHEPWPLPDEYIDTPTAYASFPRETRHPPRAFAETAFNIERWTEMERGGHFAALEVPDVLAEDVAAFFRRFRDT
jgi:pimeloyl-ACP methyl ester carboxylesterase